MYRRRYCDYSDMHVVVFVDVEKGAIIMANDKGKSEVINFEDNFYSVEEDIVVYDKLLQDSMSWHGTIKEIDIDDYHKYLNKFIKHIKKQLKGSDYELNEEYLEYMEVGVIAQ